MKMYDEDFFAYLNKEKQNKRQQSNISNGLCYWPNCCVNIDISPEFHNQCIPSLCASVRQLRGRWYVALFTLPGFVGS